MKHPLRELIEAREREVAYRARRDFYWRYCFGTSLIYLSALPCAAILCFLSGQPVAGMACLAVFAGAFGVGSITCAVLAHRWATREPADAGTGNAVEGLARG
ncbi:MAG: hypothetical protein ACX93N_03325 [Pseudohaliea sp.]